MRTILFFIVLLAHLSGYSQTFRCSFDGTPVKPIVYYPQTEEETDLQEEIIDLGEEILEDFGISTDHYDWLMARNIRNFQAEMNPRTRKMEIYYNPTFVRNLYNRLSEEDFGTVILVCICHEIGHQLCGHTTTGNGGTHESELAADYFAGKTIGRWVSEGDETEQEEVLEMCLKVYKLIASFGAGDTHPARATRMEAFMEGFEDQ